MPYCTLCPLCPLTTFFLPSFPFCFSFSVTAPWGATLGLLGGWLVFPTLTSEFKDNFGMADAPAAGAAPVSTVKYTKEAIGVTPEVA